MDPSETDLTREEVLLLVAEGGGDGLYRFDAIRAMKGCFLVSQRGRSSWRDLFAFSPYDYGPFDSGVYAARDQLISQGLIITTPGQYPGYAVTEAGQARCRELETADPEAATWLRKIGRWTTSRSFGELLREVYSEFPEYATRSIARIG